MRGHRKHRSFTSELMVWILLLVVLPLAAIMTYFYRHSASGLTEVEREKSHLTAVAARESIAGLADSILGVTVTNAYWEDNRQALLARDGEWLKRNIEDMPNVVPNIDFVSEADLEGNVAAASGGVEEFTGRMEPAVIGERFRESGEKQFTGLLDTSRGAAVVAVSQVTSDNGDQPAAGMLLTGRLLTPGILEELKTRLQTEITVYLRSGQYLATQGGLASADAKLELEELARSGWTERFALRYENGVLTARTTVPLYDMAGSVIGVIHTSVPSVSATRASQDLARMGVYMAAIMAFLLALVVWLLRRRIVLPLRHFTAALEEVAAGRKVDRMPRYVLQAEAEIVGAIQGILQWNQKLEETVHARTAAIRTLLDNAKQGFLTVGPDLRVQEEFSAECVRIFGREPAGERVDRLLYPDDEAESELVASILGDYFAEGNPLKKELIFSLLPDEIRVGGLSVQLAYKPLQGTDGNKEAVMIMLSDITGTRSLETKMEEERQTLQAVVQAVTHPEDYAAILRDYERFADVELQELLQGPGTPEDKALAVSRAVHTFKGSFGFLRFRRVVPRLHGLEDDLEELLERRSSLTLQELAGYLSAQELRRWTEEDTELLRSALGEAYGRLLAGTAVTLELERLRELERMVAALPESGDHRSWLRSLRSLRERPARTLLKPHIAYLEELAGRSGVLLGDVELQGGEVGLSAERYGAFAKSLVHVVRNIVAHGIEPPDERIAAGKDEHGAVAFLVERTEGELRFVISDDGRGIDPAALRERAIRLGIAGAGAMSDEEATGLIFRERISTATELTEWAGRGVGLSAVREEVEKLGGTIRVETKRGTGTRFEFRLPEGRQDGEVRIGA